MGHGKHQEELEQGPRGLVAGRRGPEAGPVDQDCRESSQGLAGAPSAAWAPCAWGRDAHYRLLPANKSFLSWRRAGSGGREIRIRRGWAQAPHVSSQRRRASPTCCPRC